MNEWVNDRSTYFNRLVSLLDVEHFNRRVTWNHQVLQVQCKISWEWPESNSFSLERNDSFVDWFQPWPLEKFNHPTVQPAIGMMTNPFLHWLSNQQLITTTTITISKWNKGVVSYRSLRTSKCSKCLTLSLRSVTWQTSKTFTHAPLSIDLPRRVKWWTHLVEWPLIWEVTFVILFVIVIVHNLDIFALFWQAMKQVWRVTCDAWRCIPASFAPGDKARVHCHALSNSIQATPTCSLIIQFLVLSCSVFVMISTWLIQQHLSVSR